MYVLTDEKGKVTSGMAWDSKWHAQRHRRKKTKGPDSKIAVRYVR